ncbi:sucrose-phosphate synthase [Ranunculus cassubicifolius]
MSFTYTGMTEFDMPEKDTTPIDGFPHYGIVKEDYAPMNGCIVGLKRRVLTLSQSLLKQNSCVTLVKL